MLLPASPLDTGGLEHQVSDAEIQAGEDIGVRDAEIACKGMDDMGAGSGT